MWDKQRADAERRHQEQLAAQQAEAQRQYELVLAEIERQQTAQREAETRAAAEREAERQAAAQKAAQSRQFATERNNLMGKAKTDVESAYAGFDDAYFGKFAQDFTDFYKPQIEREHRQQKDQTTFAYDDAGTLRSSMSAKAFGDLARGRAEKEGQVASEAQDRAQGFRDDIDRQKNDALSAIFAAGSAANPVLPDGTLDITSGLAGLSTQIGALSTTAKNRAQRVSRPSVNTNPLDLSLGGYAKRPSSRILAAH